MSHFGRVGPEDPISDIRWIRTAKGRLRQDAIDGNKAKGIGSAIHLPSEGIEHRKGENGWLEPEDSRDSLHFCAE